MIALPVLVAPFRALLGFKSDNHRSAIGWKRVPYLWFGTLWQFGGLAMMPLALLVLAGTWSTTCRALRARCLAALAFLMTGLGLHMTQTAGLALAADRATEETRPKVVALLYVMFLVGMGDFGADRGLAPARLFRAPADAGGAGRGGVTVGLNVIALWKQESVCAR
jgi:MFS transporter, BCD family, chlorophyll transporter